MAISLKSIRKTLWVAVAVASIGLLTLILGKPYLFPDGSGYSPAIIADFELTNQHGQVIRDEDFAGQWMLIFFGYTNCPDVCPTTIAEMSMVMEGLEDNSGKVQPIMVTIDPERDTPEVLAEYLGFFSPGLVGLTGTPEQIATTSKTFNIFYAKMTEPDAPDGYSMAHSSHVYLFNPEGEYIRIYKYGTPAEAILEDLASRI
ncbi:MAG: SCO family protein [Rhodobacteraceae bacterium]|nr:SCO family protein [Paracoccaceae bacterium]